MCRGALALILAVRIVASSPAQLAGQGVAQTNWQLPEPGGPFGIGRRVFDWTDPARPETMSGKLGGNRELLVCLFYPTDKKSPGARCDYFPHLRQVEAFEERFGKGAFRESYGSSYVAMTTMKSHAIPDAPPAPGRQGFPVVLLSHGLGVPILCYTAIIERLVSHGYVVAAIEHSYDGAEVVFPDGRIITQSGYDDDDKRTKPQRLAFHLERYKTGAADNRFVLDQLQRIDTGNLPGAPKSLKGRLNTRHAAAVGHSDGGKVSVYQGLADRRIELCMNLAGGLDRGLAYGPMKSLAFAMFGEHRDPRGPAETDDQFAARQADIERYRELIKAEYTGAPPGSQVLLVDSPAFNHYSYCDFPTAEVDKRPAWNATPQQWKHNQQIILALILAVLDDHFHRPGSTPLADLAKRLPEVRVVPIH